MIKNKTTVARESVLDMLENEQFENSDKLPGAREIASKTGMSLLMAQAAVKTLERDGILETVPRSGAYLKEGWDSCVIESNVVFFDMDLPWIPAFEQLMKRKFPHLRLSRKFKRGMFELRTTATVLSNRNDYIDMEPIFKEAFPDTSLFYNEPFRCFHQNGKLIGVPFIFSPRVILYNPAIFKSFSCPEPHPGWTWDEFISIIRFLRKHLQGKSIFDFNYETFHWSNFIFHAGGALFDPGSEDPVKIDSPQTRRGLLLFSQIQSELGLNPGELVYELASKRFARGELAMMLMPRESRTWFGPLGFKSWNAVPLPSIPGGTGRNTQATDLVCVRRECRDKKQAVDFLKFMLSEKVQDFIGSQFYGIPVRKSSANKSLDRSLPGDKVFFDEIPQMTANYNIDSPEISEMVYEGIGRIWRDGMSVNEATAEIASALRIYMKVRKHRKI